MKFGDIAAALVVLYHQGGEIETAFLELKYTILGGRVLRTRSVEGVTQEIYALLITYQFLRTAMAEGPQLPRNQPHRPDQLQGHPASTSSTTDKLDVPPSP